MHTGLAVPEEAAGSAATKPLDVEPVGRTPPDQAGDNAGHAIVFTSDPSDRPSAGPDNALAAFLQNAGKPAR
jgi:hypothetical protein